MTNLLVHVGTNFLNLQFVVFPVHESLSISDIEEVYPEVQIDRWSPPQLENLALVAEYVFLNPKSFFSTQILGFWSRDLPI